jgi:hypothetical protein
MPTVHQAVRQALRADNPASLSALAREAGLSPVLLHYFRTDQRVATPAAARRLAAALHRWARRCGRGARRLTLALATPRRRP